MTHENSYTGETPVTIGGKEYTIAFTFEAFAALKTKLGDMEITKSLFELEFEKVLVILECGLMAHHPEMTVEKMKKMVIPVNPIINALNKALMYAMTGDVKDFEETEENTTLPPAKAARRKTG